MDPIREHELNLTRRMRRQNLEQAEIKFFIAEFRYHGGQMNRAAVGDPRL